MTSFCSKSYKMPGTLSAVSTDGNSVGLSSEVPFQLLGASLSLVASRDWLNEKLGPPFKRTLPLSNDLVPPSNDFDVPLACFRTELVLEDKDLNWELGVLLDKNPFEVNFEILSAPPRDWRREGPLLTLLPSAELLLLLLEVPRKLSSSTLSRKWNFSWKKNKSNVLLNLLLKTNMANRYDICKPKHYFQLSFRLRSSLSYSKLVSKLLHFPLQEQSSAISQLHKCSEAII